MILCFLGRESAIIIIDIVINSGYGVLTTETDIKRDLRRLDVS